MVVPSDYVPDQGHIITISLDPQAGREQAGRRPVLILSVERYNSATSLCVCCPITNSVKGNPFEIEVPKGLPVTGVILSDQIKSLDWRVREAEHECDVPIKVVSDVLQRVNLLFQQESSD